MTLIIVKQNPESLPNAKSLVCARRWWFQQRLSCFLLEFLKVMKTVMRSTPHCLVKTWMMVVASSLVHKLDDVVSFLYQKISLAIMTFVLLEILHFSGPWGLERLC